MKLNKKLSRAVFASILFSACGGDDGAEAIPSTLKTDAPVSFFAIYQSETQRIASMERPWVPVDLSPSPNGELWVVQRVNPLDEYANVMGVSQECPEDFSGDCGSMDGSTVAITDAQLPDVATEENGGAKLVSDYNAWHFMRRPSAIAFGAAATSIEPDDEGAYDMDARRPAITETATYTNTFATCHEHRTANSTDSPVNYIGPALWTSDPAIYNGRNGRYDWSNGSHLDMLHGTPYCMGIAHDTAAENGYWMFNGMLGVIDFNDFGPPHIPGHWYHDNATVKRYEFGEETLTRLPYVPSNLEIVGTHLYIADTGAGRVVRIDLANEGEPTGTFSTLDPVRGDTFELALETVLSRESLEAIWGANVAPSGIGVLDAETLVVANYGSGHLALVGLDGTVIRNIDTGLGEGLGGVTVMDGRIYFTHLNERRVYRLDVAE